MPHYKLYGKLDTSIKNKILNDVAEEFKKSWNEIISA